MENQLKGDFTRRLSQCNAGGMIVIIYDIFFAYLEDAKKGIELDCRDDFKAGLRGAQSTLDELIYALDFKYELSVTLYSLYHYCKEILSKAMYEYKLDKVYEVEKIMTKLYESFKEVAKQDTSEPIMTNTQQVYAGMTYGKYELNENFADNNSRGFLV